MKTLFKLICIIVLTLSINSCGVGWQINSYNPDYSDENYHVEVIQTQSQLDWKLRTDWTFANNYYLYLQRQNYSFFQNQYYRNRLYRFGWNSPHDYWMNWQWNWHNGYNGYGGGWNSWNQYPYYGNWNTNYWWNHQNNHPYYSHIYGPRTSYLGNVYGRNLVYGRRLQTYRNLSNTNRKISQQRNTKPNRNTTPIINNKPVINTKPVIRNKPVINTKPPVRTKPEDNIRTLYPSGFINSNPTTRPNNTRPTTRPVNTKPPVRTKTTVPQTSKKRGGQ